MKRLLGYAAHRASVALHGVAERCLREVYCGQARPGFRVHRGEERNCFGERYTPELPITISDVAPRIADASDYIRRKWQHVSWLAMASATGRKGRF